MCREKTHWQSVNASHSTPISVIDFLFLSACKCQLFKWKADCFVFFNFLVMFHKVLSAYHSSSCALFHVLQSILLGLVYRFFVYGLLLMLRLKRIDRINMYWAVSLKWRNEKKMKDKCRDWRCDQQEKGHQFWLLCKIWLPSLCPATETCTVTEAHIEPCL